MKVKDICKQYELDEVSFENWLANLSKNINFSIGLTSYSVKDADVSKAVSQYNEYLVKKDQKAAEKLEAEEQKRQIAEEKNAVLAEMLVTSGFNFDGYKITRYSGYISGDDCVTMPRNNFWGTNSVDQNLCDALVKIRRQALKELKEAAYELGCNAVIGVDFDYLVMDPQHGGTLNAQITVYEPYVICVTANGNAVVIEKE